LVAMKVESAPKQILPTKDALAVTYDIDFSWDGFAGGVDMIDVEPLAPGPEFHIVTRKLTTRIPDLTPQGMGLPPATLYSWFVNGFGPFASVDEAAGPDRLLSPTVDPGVLPSPTVRSTTLYFTTK
jgi:hypothetical protein